MTDKEYMEALYRCAEISKILTLQLGEEAQELFEEYCELQLAILKAELFG